MERTELREQFFADVRRDPYAHMVTHLVSDAWANGYEQALRDHGLDEARARETHGDRVDRAIEWLTDARRKSYAQAIVALAEVGPLVGVAPRIPR